MFLAPDNAQAACPDECRAQISLRHTLIEDESMTTAEAALVALLPETTIARYRAVVSIQEAGMARRIIRLTALAIKSSKPGMTLKDGGA